MSLSEATIPTYILPAEILSRVFRIAVASLPCVNQSKTRLVSHPLVVIPSVCVWWRQVALDTASLWTHIDVFEESFKLRIKVQVNKMMDRAILWSERARNLPIDLDFISDCSPVTRELPYNTKKLIMRGGSLNFLSDSHGHWLKQVIGFYGAGGRSEKLKAITLAEINPSPGAGSFKWCRYIPNTLTTLKLISNSRDINLDLDDLIELLSRTNNMRTLLLKNISPSINPNQNYPEVRLSNLEYLELFVFPSTVHKHLFRSITPGVCELDLRFNLPDINDAEYNHAALNFFRRSRIACLHMVCFTSATAPLLAQYLDYVPNLRTLRLNFIHNMKGDSLDALNVLGDGGYRARCPRLQTLCLLSANIAPQAQAQLMEIIKTHNLTELVFACGSCFVDESGKPSGADEILAWLQARVARVELKKGWDHFSN